MRSLRIISNTIQDNVICNLVDIGSTPGIYPLSHLAAGYLIQIIALLDKEKISEWQLKSKDKCQELSRRISLTAKLCMDGYMRSVDHAIESSHSITVLLTACLYILRDLLIDRSIYSEHSQIWKENAAKLFDIIKKSADIRKMSTVDLSRLAKSLSLMQKTGMFEYDSDILVESSLELLYRRNKFGFFCFDAYDQSTLPLSKQFFVLDCLLECRHSTVLGIISRDALEVFNTLCSTARKSPTGHFSFRSGETIIYSAESIGNILMGVSALLPCFVETNQFTSTTHILDELYCKLLLSRLAGRKNAAFNIKNSYLTLKSDMATHITESLTSLFADRIILNFSEQSIRYMPPRHLNNWQTLYLCRCLLDVAKRVKLLAKLH
jgi:hypothetical protein